MSKNKLILAILLCGLALIIAACNGAPGNEEPAPDPQEPEDGPEESRQEPHLDGRHGRDEFQDENVKVEISFDRADYTAENIIGLEVTVTNQSQQTIAFPRGSGSNRVPDGIRVTLGELVPLYKPMIMTMDFQVDELEPGESVTYQLPFAPFINIGPNAGFGVGFDLPLEFFHTDEYQPAQPGEMPIGDPGGTRV